MSEPAGQRPLPYAVAVRGVARCAVQTVRLLRERRIRWPRSHVGARLQFANGTTGRVYRETAVDRLLDDEPCILVVSFRLRWVHDPAMHTLFRWESWLNTPLFAGFPGLVSKLWLAHDEHDVYRGLYEWDGAERAEHYARCLWRVLALVSVRGSIGYSITPRLTRDDLLAAPGRLAGAADDAPGWARLVAVDGDPSAV